MKAWELNQPTTTRTVQTIDTDPLERDTRSPKEKWAQRNKESLERQRQRRQEREKGDRPIQNGRPDYATRQRPNDNPFDSGGGGGAQNTTVGLCVNGTPYLIDINASDLYAVTEDPNFPPVEP